MFTNIKQFYKENKTMVKINVVILSVVGALSIGYSNGMKEGMHIGFNKGLATGMLGNAMCNADKIHVNLIPKN